MSNKPNWKRCQIGNMGVFDTPLGVNCGEDGVDKDKNSNDVNA